MKGEGGARIALAAVAIAAGLGPLTARARPADAVATLRQERRSMTLRLHGPPGEIFSLFGPVRESEWAPGWNPRFVAPPVPAQSPEGAVFKTDMHGGEAVWVMTVYDTARGKVSYVIVQPELVTCELAIQVRPDGPNLSRAEVTYRYTALTELGNQFVGHWAEQFPQQAAHWEHAINGRLAAEGASR